MNLIFDTHAHYDDEAFDADREELLASMPENGVGLIVDPGCDLETSRRAVEIAGKYPHKAFGEQYGRLRGGTCFQLRFHRSGYGAGENPSASGLQCGRPDRRRCLHRWYGL